MNLVIMSGNLTRDPEIREGNSGKFATYTLAVQGRKDAADFFNCTVFGDKPVEYVSKYLKKGSRVCLQGRLSNRSYEKDGQKHTTTSIVVFNHELAIRSTTAAAASEDTNQNQNLPSTEPEPDYGFDPAEMDEDLPFA